jgi:hypothetical protein
MHNDTHHERLVRSIVPVADVKPHRYERTKMTHQINSDNYFSIIPEWVLNLPISANAVRLYAILQRYADKDSGKCHPSRRTLADRCMVSVSSLDRALAELIEVGAVRKKHRVNASGDMTSNQYTVITVAGVASKTTPPLFTSDETGGITSDAQTRVSMNQSHEPNNAKSIAEEWWQQYKQRTDGKSPVGKGAWHSLLAVINAALNAGWEPEQVRTAIMACTVPSSAQLDRELNKTTSGVVQPVQASKQQVRHIPAITGDKACEACSGTGVMVVFDDEADQWKSIKCDCYTETYAY